MDIRSIQQLVREERIKVTLHALEEMAEESFLLDDVLDAILSGVVIEDYPEHKRGACCLIGGYTRARRSAHIVCTTAQPVLIIITVYEPRLPKWKSMTERNRL